MQRAINKRKFDATLKKRLDNAEEDWHKAQPPMMPSPIQVDDLHIRAPWHDQNSDQTD
jgi:hypothetical protein